MDYSHRQWQELGLPLSIGQGMGRRIVVKRRDTAAGASAHAEAQRRRHEAGWLGALRPTPQSTRAWERGAQGERRVGRRLDKLAPRGVITLHDRRIRGSRANLDHIAICASGVWVIDTKNYRGKVERRDVSTWFGQDLRLFVAGWDRTSLIDGAVRQARHVTRAIADDTVPVHAVLCFTRSDWSFLAPPFRIQDVMVCWPKRLARELVRAGDITPSQRKDLAGLLAHRFPDAILA